MKERENLFTMGDIRVMFVLPKEVDHESAASEVMVQAFEVCKQTVKTLLWVKEAELDGIDFTPNRDYLVFENFQGRDFSALIEKKCMVLGPKAMLVCLSEGKPIPSFQWPILNVKMYGCEVTCTHLPKPDKQTISRNVRLMGGVCTSVFAETTTHLICDRTISEKYKLAVEREIKVMLPKWVDYLFNTTEDVDANDQEILDKYRCPAFHHLTICSSGLSSNERKKVGKLIEENGGTMVSHLNISKTDVLICHGVAGTTSEKYKAASKLKADICVSLDWVYNSVERGYALPLEHYKVKSVAVSTPTKDGENIDPNFSTISTISAIVGSASNRTLEASLTHSIKKNNKRKADEDLVDKLDIKKVKSAGSFLEGCSVLVVGFSPSVRDKLNKIINISGATRYDSFSSRVSHVIVGDSHCSEVISIKTSNSDCVLVNVHWLIDSVEQRRPMNEEMYLSNDSNAKEGTLLRGSPLNKKVLTFLQGDSSLKRQTSDVTGVAAAAAAQEDALTQKYLQGSNVNNGEEEDTLAKFLNQQEIDPFTSKEKGEFGVGGLCSMREDASNKTMEFRPNNTSTQLNEEAESLQIDILPIFSNLTFFFDGFNEEEMEMIVAQVTAARGTIADRNFEGCCDYAVYPTVWQPDPPKAKEIVNILWFNRCLEDQTLYTDLKYYHRIIETPSVTPLTGCVITISSYTSDERHFLREVIERLGGIYQEQFSRKTRQEKNILACTHLVCPEPNGKKYEAAVQWGLPVVSRDWVLECLRKCTKAPIENYFIATESGADEQVIVPKDASMQRVTDVKSDITKTPVNQVRNLRKSIDGCSQVTPVNKLIQEAIDNKVLPTPPTPRTYYPWDPKTPDTPLEAFFTPNPNRALRKELQRYLNSFPDFDPPARRRLSTPLSELKRRLVDKLLGRGEFCEDTQRENLSLNDETEQINEDRGEAQPQHDSSGVDQAVEPDDQDVTESPCENVELQQKLQELHQIVMANGSASATRTSISRMFESTMKVPGIEKSSEVVQSQVFTVGWDYGEDRTQNPQSKVFMFSGIEINLREELTANVKDLGAAVLTSVSYDPSVTHLICPRLAKNEKTLASMAAGKWILHISYIEKSKAAGRFLEEEEFEFGNPNARANVSFGKEDGGPYFWRREVSRRGYGAFNDMRAIVVAESRIPIINVIKAGGGVVVNVEPPFEDAIHATHCLLEIKMVKDFSAYVPLAQQGIKCFNTVYVNDYLRRINKDDSDYLITHLLKYYRK
ncbi:DNA topoisomerase 2-binding protein 1-A [Euwallacea fornicatus]|uniref:DNA topoisomerase 2-binding protein 1-A n=1 Tax=Euwallacea fornicatus TaxID=995702 RepID=UPI00338F1DE3